MFWIVLLIIVAIIALWASTPSGKIIMGCTSLALGSLLLSWIMDIAFLIEFAKFCLIVIVVTIFLGAFICIMKA